MNQTITTEEQINDLLKKAVQMINDYGSRILDELNSSEQVGQPLPKRDLKSENEDLRSICNEVCVRIREYFEGATAGNKSRES